MVSGDIVLLNDGNVTALEEFDTTGNFTDSSTTPDPISGATYDSVSFAFTAQDGSPWGVLFNADGTKMFMLGLANKTFYQYSLSTAYLVSSATYDSVSFSVSAQASEPRDVVFNGDGTKFYISNSATNTIYQYTLPTPYSLIGASYDSVSFNPSEESVLRGCTFKDDGTKLYVVGVITDTVYQYTLSTPYSLSSVVYDSKSLVVSQDATPVSLRFNNDGSKLYILGQTTDDIFQYSLSTPFDVSTGSYDSVSFSATSQDANPTSMEFNADGTKLYVTGLTDSIYQYSVNGSINGSTEYTLDITSAGLTSAPTTVVKDTAEISTSLVGTGAGDSFEARTAQSHTGDASTAPTKITDVFDTDTRTGRDFKVKAELAKSGDEVTRISIPIEKLG